MADENMTKLKVLQLYASVVFMVVAVLPKTAESTLVIYFNHAPPARSRSSTAVFQYLVEKLDGSNPCKKDVCSFSCECISKPPRNSSFIGHYDLLEQLDDQVFPCQADSIVLKNLTVNQKHKFLLNVTSHEGERNSSAYSWFIDAIPPTAIISREQMYTNARKITVNITFSEPCTGLGGFSCINSTNCDVMVTGPAHVLPSSLQIIRPGTEYSLELVLSSKTIQGRATIRLRDNICADQAGNLFKATNTSTVIIHIDRRPVIVDFWTSVPSYELIINRVPRTVVATSKREDLTIFLHFSIPIRNSTEQILKSLHVNSGFLVPIHVRLNENRKFAFKLVNISRTEILAIELQTTSILGKTGTPVSPVAPITFLYDSVKPSVVLRTSSPNVTKESDIDIIVEFTKPVFGFQASVVEVLGGRLIRLKEVTRALYSLTVQAVTQTVVSVTIPAGKLTDISGNENMASNQLEVKHYSTPPISIGLHSFVTAGTVATSLVAALVTLSSANLEAISIPASGGTKCGASIPSMNLNGMVGHLQVFALTNFFSVNQPLEYSETTRGLQWLIPRHKLPWKDYGTSVWTNNFILVEENITNDLSIGAHAHLQDQLPFPIETTHKSGWPHHQHNINMTNTFYGLPLTSSEYFIYFLRGEPMSAIDLVRSLENYEGWGDLEMNLFWLGVGGGSLLLIHVFTLYFIIWRTGQPSNGSLSVPRFELLLLILMLPCISQSSVFVIKGGTTGGIITGALLLTIPVAFILSASLFLVIAIFSGSFAQYKEVRELTNEESWYKKLWFFLTGCPTTGKWFYKEGLSSSFLPRFGILFESWKGTPVLGFVDQNDPNTIAKWTESGRSGIGRMKAVSSDDSNEEIKTPFSKRVLGCARSSYIIIDLSRRIGLGIISVAYSSEQSSKSLLALIITLAQFIYLVIIKPYIRRGIQVVESFSLLCEVGVFGIFVLQNGSNLISGKASGYVLLVLLLFTFTAQLVYQWYAIIISILRVSQHQKNSFKHGLEFTTKGLILPFLPRKHWSTVISKSSQSKTGPENPLSSGLQLERRKRNGYMDPISAMTATVVPVLSPGGPVPNVMEGRDPTTSETVDSVHRESESKQLKAQKDAQKDDLKKLREMARASFLYDSIAENASTSYASVPFSGKPK